MNPKRINVMHILHTPHIYVEIGMVVWVTDAGNIKLKWSEN